MSIIKVNHERNFTQVSNEAVRDKRLSLKARGLHHLLLSYPHHWEIYIPALLNECDRDGRESIRAGIKELEDLGYITREQSQDEKGRFTGWAYTIFELAQKQPENQLSPQTDPQSENPTTDYPKSEKPTTENRHHRNIYINNTEFNKNSLSPNPSHPDTEAERENFAEIIEILNPEMQLSSAAFVPSINSIEVLPAQPNKIGEGDFSAAAPQPKFSSFDSVSTIAQKLVTGEKVVQVPRNVAVAIGSQENTSFVQLDINDFDYRNWIVGTCIRKMRDQPERNSLNEDLLISSLARKPETQKRYVQYCQTTAVRAEVSRQSLAPPQIPKSQVVTISSKCAFLQAKWSILKFRALAIAEANTLGLIVDEDGIRLSRTENPDQPLSEWEAF
jgi:hypothetical protein